ncbi:hypothetical protein [Gordonia phthalatica]|uniref:hypothetical protein n=1 Tax=Gordonia phthalatica TaxID=1136941 RepID=UPI000A865512|nr:hypothetical protein [Gordonia phthalatica]
MVQESAVETDRFTLGAGATLRILCVAVPVLLVVAQAGIVTILASWLTWCLVAIVLGIQPTWDEGYRLDRPRSESALIYGAWFLGFVLLVLGLSTVLALTAIGDFFSALALFLVYAFPAVLVAVVIYAICRVLARWSARRHARHGDPTSEDVDDGFDDGAEWFG